MWLQTTTQFRHRICKHNYFSIPIIAYRWKKAGPTLVVSRLFVTPTGRSPIAAILHDMVQLNNKKLVHKEVALERLQDISLQLQSFTPSVCDVEDQCMKKNLESAFAFDIDALSDIIYGLRRFSSHKLPVRDILRFVTCQFIYHRQYLQLPDTHQQRFSLETEQHQETRLELAAASPPSSSSPSSSSSSSSLASSLLMATSSSP